MITIHFDFTDGTEVSFIEGKKLKDGFVTNVLEFFSFDIDFDVKVIKRNGDYILKSELLSDNGEYTTKQIREEHNIQKMLVTEIFKWKNKDK